MGSMERRCDLDRLRGPLFGLLVPALFGRIVLIVAAGHAMARMTGEPPGFWTAPLRNRVGLPYSLIWRA
jgi:hypothetical protein